MKKKKEISPTTAIRLEMNVNGGKRMATTVLSIDDNNGYRHHMAHAHDRTPLQYRNEAEEDAKNSLKLENVYLMMVHGNVVTYFRRHHTHRFTITSHSSTSLF